MLAGTNVGHTAGILLQRNQALATQVLENAFEIARRQTRFSGETRDGNGLVFSDQSERVGDLRMTGALRYMMGHAQQNEFLLGFGPDAAGTRLPPERFGGG